MRITLRFSIAFLLAVATFVVLNGAFAQNVEQIADDALP